jgi:hypothetical protein
MIARLTRNCLSDRSILTELAARRMRGSIQRSPSPASAVLAVAAAAQTLARSPSRLLAASPRSQPESGGV